MQNTTCFHIYGSRSIDTVFQPNPQDPAYFERCRKSKRGGGRHRWEISRTLATIRSLRKQRAATDLYVASCWHTKEPDISTGPRRWEMKDASSLRKGRGKLSQRYVVLPLGIQITCYGAWLCKGRRLFTNRLHNATEQCSPCLLQSVWLRSI